jgi:hypothetical protein
MGRRFALGGDPNDLDNVQPSLSHQSPTPPCFTSTPENAALGEGARVDGAAGKSKIPKKDKKGGIASICLFVDPRPAEEVYAVVVLC